MNEMLKGQLIKLYDMNSKHSNYQILASNYHGILRGDEIRTSSRYEQERWDYIKSRLTLKNQRVLDIGANTGFFTFEALNEHAEHVDYYEGNQAHAEFVDLSARYFGLEHRISIHNEYYLFDQKNKNYFDVTLLLNVLHHLGDDYGNASINIQEAKDQILNQLNFMAYHTKRMVFQLGFNWKGNREICLFDHGTKREMIDYITKGTKNYWDMECIGIAVKTDDGKVIFEDLSEKNCERIDELGEFLNRPLFIMKSLKQKDGNLDNK